MTTGEDTLEATLIGFSPEQITPMAVMRPQACFSICSS